jgi:hypothetical protein
VALVRDLLNARAMTLLRLRVLLAFGALALVQTYGCDSSPISPDGGGADATAGASQGTAGHAGGAGGTAGHGTAGATGTAGHGTAGATGSAGHGSAGATGTAGHTGGGGAGSDGGVSCSDLEAQYSAALGTARSCTVSASGQCTQMVSGDLSPCFSNCQIFVNDATALNALKAQWLQAGCGAGVFACPAIACLQPSKGECVAGDGGGGICQPGQNGLQ